MGAPRLLSEERADELGAYTAYLNKSCTVIGCGVNLTSRNRHGTSLLCIPHGQEKDRKRDSGNVRKRRCQSNPSLKNQDRQRLQSIFAGWLNSPTLQIQREALKHAMTDYELKVRLRQIVPPMSPPKTSPSTPEQAPRQALHPTQQPGLTVLNSVEEISFTNPNHRTTHGEFLSDCSTYGV